VDAELHIEVAGDLYMLELSRLAETRCSGAGADRQVRSELSQP
jgi:hypothetical protein